MLTYENKLERLKESDDKALRLGFYRYIDSDYDIKYELNIESCYEKDGVDFLEQALRNPNFYKSKEVRDKLDEMIYSIKIKDDEDYECSSKSHLRSLYNYQIEIICKLAESLCDLGLVYQLVYRLRLFDAELIASAFDKKSSISDFSSGLGIMPFG